MKRITPSRNAFGSQHESSSLAWNGSVIVEAAGAARNEARGALRADVGDDHVLHSFEEGEFWPLAAHEKAGPSGVGVGPSGVNFSSAIRGNSLDEARSVMETICVCR